jgi:hypothetical protein
VKHFHISPAGGASGLSVSELRAGGQSLRVSADQLRLLLGRSGEPAALAAAQHELPLPLPGATSRDSVAVVRQVPRGQRRSCVLRARSRMQH